MVESAMIVNVACRQCGLLSMWTVANQIVPCGAASMLTRRDEDHRVESKLV